LEKPVSLLAKTEDIEFVVICNSDPHLQWDGVNVRFVPWAPQTEITELQQLDLGLMPLRDEPFERGKCGLKAIQYMGVGVPAVVSPVGANREIVTHGDTGFHCSSDTDWVQRIKSLIRDEPLRKQMARAARVRVVDEYSVQSLMPLMLEIFKKVALVGRVT
jgi:glycosyltransferase involved in cell wall biosynthesis